jgi:hypothetical protein
MIYLFANELPRLGGGGFAGLFVGAGSVQRFLLGHVGVLLRMFGEGRTQLYFRAFEYAAAGSAQAFAGAVDLEIVLCHGSCRLSSRLTLRLKFFLASQ